MVMFNVAEKKVALRFKGNEITSPVKERVPSLNGTN